MNRLIGMILQVMGAVLFVVAGAEWPPLIIPAAISSLSGLALWTRRSGPAAPLLPPPDPALEERLARIEERLIGVHEDTQRLREAREFMDDLYAGQGAPELPPASR